MKDTTFLPCAANQPKNYMEVLSVLKSGQSKGILKEGKKFNKVTGQNLSCLWNV